MGEGAIDVLWGRAAFQRDLERPKEWHNRNLVKFNKDKCKIPHRSRKNSLQEYRLRNGSGEKDTEVLVGSTLNMNQPSSKAHQQHCWV